MYNRIWLIGMLAAFAVLAASPRAFAAEVKVVDSNAGQVASAHVKRYGDWIYVTGSVYRGSSPTISPHLHIEWRDDKNAVLISKNEDVTISGHPFLTRTIPFSVRFPAASVAKAKTVQVSYVGFSHVFCAKPKGS